MGTSGAVNFPLSNGDVVEDSETTVEIKIKTLDSQTFTLRVNKFVPVPALKEQIATVTGVLSEQQRLICRGRVLKDDQLLSAYHVEDGHTLHLVVRQPHQSSSTFIGPEGQPVNSAPDIIPSQVSRTIVLEAVNIDQADVEPTILNRIMTNILNSFGASNNGSGNVSSSNIREASSEWLPRSFGDTVVSNSQNQPNIASLINQYQPNITTHRIESDRQPAAFPFSTAVSPGPPNLPAIPHSLTTIHQYLAHLKNAFRRELPVSNDRDHSSSGDTSNNEGGDFLSLSHHSSRRDDLPSPTALAEILQSTRQLLAEHVDERLLELARELENDTSITDHLLRLNVQSNAIRTGFFLQNLGSLLLELGRTTMTLRMGQSPAESVVNAGPAVFISASGPNPVMVQPVPFYPAPSFGGSYMGSSNPGLAPEEERLGSATFPRNIDIRIHAANETALGGALLQQENSNSARISANSGSVLQPVQAQPQSTSLTGEFGLRVVPVRTVVAMPAGISGAQSNLSVNLVPLLHPLLSRIQQQSSVNVNDDMHPQAFPLHQNGAEAGHEPIPDSVRQILESYIGGSVQEAQVPSYTVPVVSGPSMSPTVQIEHQGTRVYIAGQQMQNGYGERSSHVNDDNNAGQVSLPQDLNLFNHPSSRLLLGEQVNSGDAEQQEFVPDSGIEQLSIDRDAELNDASVSAIDQGVLFSSFLHHLMPLLTQDPAISQVASSLHSNPSTLENQRMSLDNLSSSQHQRDPPESPSPKRHKRE